MHWRVGTVVAQARAWGSAREYRVRLEPTPAAGSGGDAGSDVDAGSDGHAGSDGRAEPGTGVVRALGYRDVVGDLIVGGRVLLNVSALQRGLGTGGMALIVAPAERLPADPPTGPGHIVKARYTPQQQMVLALDEQESPHHAALLTGPAGDGDLTGMPVVAADLHSALPAILAGVRDVAPAARVVYLMTDGGALPAAFSMALAGLRDAGWLAASVTVGQAYGGDHEAVTLHSGLLAARHVLGADLAIVIQGPGNAGTGTPYGFSGLGAGEALNAVHVLRGRGIGALRIGDADPRERHRGISHHSRTAYGRLVLGAATIVVPRLDGDFGALVAAQAHDLAGGAAGRLTVAEEAVDGLWSALQTSPVRLSSMGRGLEEDRAYFLAQAAAGRHAARLITPGQLSDQVGP